MNDFRTHHIFNLCQTFNINRLQNQKKKKMCTGFASIKSKHFIFTIRMSKISCTKYPDIQGPFNILKHQFLPISALQKLPNTILMVHMEYVKLIHEMFMENGYFFKHLWGLINHGKRCQKYI